jgi:hypothetical protein
MWIDVLLLVVLFVSAVLAHPQQNAAVPVRRHNL